MTTIQDTLTYADGSFANGRLVVYWKPFTVSSVNVAGGELEWEITDGAILLELYSNATALPGGSYYNAKYELDDGVVYVEQWIVPNLPTVNIGEVRVAFPPSPSVMISPLQLTSLGGQPGMFLMWDGTKWVPGYPTTFNMNPNWIIIATGTVGSDVGVTGSPVSLGQTVTINIPDAGATARGVVNTGAQTFAGNKTFNGTVNVPGSATIGSLTVTGAVTLPANSYVPVSRKILPGTGLTGGGDLTIDRTLAVVNDTSTQRVRASFAGGVLATRQELNFINGANVSITVVDDTANNRANITVASIAITDPTSAKGDMLARSASALARLLVGADGQILTADSGQALGVKWAAPAPGGVTSVFSRSGAVVAQAGDYIAAQVINAVDTTGSYANPVWITSLAWSKITGVPATGVASVFTRTGAVVAAAGDYTAAQVTNAVSILGSYADPVWITSLAWSKITGTPATGVASVFTRTGAVVAAVGDYTAAQVTNAVDMTGSYSNPVWITSLAWSKITGAPASTVSSVFTRTGAVTAQAGDYTAAQVTNAVSTLGSYSDPAWLTSLAWSKITGTPATGVASVFARTGAVLAQAGDYIAAQVTNAVDATGSYANPVWITSLAWSKITGAPAAAVSSVFTRTGAVVAATGDYTAAQVTNAVSILGSYADPVWITALAWTKITGTPAYVPASRQVIAGSGLSGGGPLTADVTLAAVPMGASGPSTHAAGIVPDPGATLGAARYLREDATWGIPAGTGGGLTDPTTTYGDLIVRGPSATTRLGRGSDGQVLTTDSTQTVGLKWAAATGGAGGGLDYSGNYVTPHTYNDGDIVIASDGIAYICVKDGTTTPPEPWPGVGIASGPAVIQDEGVPLTQRTVLNFVGSGVTAVDDPANNRTTVTIAGGGGGSQTPWLSNIDAGSHDLNNVANIFGNGNLTMAGSPTKGEIIIGDAIEFYPNTYVFVYNAKFGVNKVNPTYHCDIVGDCNVTGVYRQNGVPISTGGGSQTPWTSNIDAGNFQLSNVNAAGVGTSTISSGVQLDVAGNPTAPNWCQLMIRPLASNNGSAVTLVSMFAGTTQKWYFGAGSGSGNNNFRIVDLTGANIDALNIAPGGNVGIRTASPSYALDTVGDVNCTGKFRVAGQPLRFRATHTFALVGDVTAVTTLPSFFVALVGTQAALLYGVRADIRSGTSVGVQVVRNGSNVGSVITVTATSATTTLGSVSLADGDEITLVLSSPVGAPSNFGASLILEHWL